MAEERPDGKKGGDYEFAPKADDLNLAEAEGDFDFTDESAFSSGEPTRGGDYSLAHGGDSAGDSSEETPKAGNEGQKERYRRAARERARYEQSAEEQAAPSERAEETKPEKANEAKEAKAEERDESEGRGRLRHESKGEKLRQDEKAPALREERARQKPSDAKRDTDKASEKRARQTASETRTAKQSEAKRGAETKSGESPLREKSSKLSETRTRGKETVKNDEPRTKLKFEKKDGAKDKKRVGDVNVDADGIAADKNLAIEAATDTFNTAKSVAYGTKDAIKATGKAVKGAAKSVKGTIRATGKTAELAGKAVKATGKFADTAGKGMSAAGKAAANAGKALGPVGMPLAFIGSATDVAGKGVSAAGKGAEIAGMGVEILGRGVQRAGGGGLRFEKKKTAWDGNLKAEKSKTARTGLHMGKKGTGRDTPEKPRNFVKESVKSKLKQEMSQRFRDEGTPGAGAAGIMFSTTVKAATKTVKIVAKKAVIPVLFSSAGPVFVLIIITVLIMLFGGGGLFGAWPLLPDTINNVEDYYRRKEVVLEYDIMALKEEYAPVWPFGADLIRINGVNWMKNGVEVAYIDLGLGHDPYALVSYMAAQYKTFAMSETAMDPGSIFIRGKLDELFGLQYGYAKNYHLVRGVDENGNAVEWRVLDISINIGERNIRIGDLAMTLLSDTERMQYNIYMNARGGMQFVAAPVDMQWANLITTNYGYYAGPNPPQVPKRENVTIAAPNGTEILAGIDGTVVDIRSEPIAGIRVEVLGKLGNYEVKAIYGGLSSLSVSAGQEVKAGDALGKSGALGFGFGITLNGIYVNPLFFADTKDNDIFVPGVGASLTLPVYEYPPPPTLDPLFLQKFLEEAVLYTGTPYKLGAKPNPASPSAPVSFDCASFVGYVLAKTGYENDMHYGATHTYNKYCAPVTQDEAKPGDLMFFHTTYDSPRPLTHVAIYLGDGKMVHSGNPNKIVYFIGTELFDKHFYTFARIKT